MANPSYAATAEWDCLFGTKQNMVMNLQKLIHALAVLDGEGDVDPTAEGAGPVPMTIEEIGMLKAWLGE
jgi:hypothetical protein